jgi:hypothetical protein
MCAMRVSAQSMSLTYERDDVRRRITVITAGVVTGREILAMVDRQAAEGTWSYAMLYDASTVDSVASADEVRVLERHVAMLSRAYGPRGAVAVLTREPAIFGMVRMYATLGESSHQCVDVFRNPPDAERWLAQRVV